VINSNLGPILHRLATVHLWWTDRQTVDGRTPTHANNSTFTKVRSAKNAHILSNVFSETTIKSTTWCFLTLFFYDFPGPWLFRTCGHSGIQLCSGKQGTLQLDKNPCNYGSSVVHWPFSVADSLLTVILQKMKPNKIRAAASEGFYQFLIP